MKFDFKYIYIVLGLFVVGMITYFIVVGTPTKDNLTNQMPDDEIHRNLLQRDSVRMDTLLLNTIDSLKSAIDKNPKDTIALHRLGFLLLQAHKFDEAESYFEKMLSINPENVDIMNVLAEVNFNLQKFPKAESYLNRIVKIQPNNEAARYNLGVVFMMQGKKEEAKKVWTEIVKENPTSEIGRLSQETLESLSK